MSAPFPTCYLDGEFLPLAAARISPLDRGFLFADGVYEVVPVYARRPFRLGPHLDRLDASLAAIGMANPLGREAWLQVLGRLVAESGADDLLLYLQVTRGAENSRSHLIPEGLAPTVFAFASPFPVPAPGVLERGLAAVTLDDLRWLRCDIKSIALLANVLLRDEARRRGADEALLVRDGLLLEGASSSVFVCRRGEIATPPNSRHLLPGTTRDVVLELAAGQLPAGIRPIRAEELPDCDELWIASAGRGVLPVTRLDGRPVGDGRPGPAWQRMARLFRDHVAAVAATPAL